MKFLWPDMLWLIAALPLLVAGYVLMVRRRSQAALRYANVGLVREAMRGRAFRRHIPPLLLLIALAAMFLSMARPAAVLTLPSHHDTVILAMDVSGSMRADDVEPNRLAAAQAAAKSFIAEQPAGTRIGIVEFSGMAALVQPPTASRAELERAIDALRPQGATALGSAILVALKTVFPEAEIDLQSLRRQRTANPPPASTVAPGSFRSAAVIVLADGGNSAGPDPIEAARLAAQRGLRIYTVGFGTEKGEIRWDSGTSTRVALDEPTLRTIAELTGAEYLRATSASQLKEVYRMLNARSILEKKYTEITALFCAAAATILAAASLLSVLWFSRPA